MNNHTTKHPNILLIMSDQQRWDTLGCYGQTAIKTPQLDTLAAEGACFETCYTTNPICTPARASMFTGKHILGHGVTKLYDLLADDEILFTQQLQAAGYQTALIGKLHVSSGVHEQTQRHPHDGFDMYNYCIEASVGMDSPYNGYVNWLEQQNPAFLAELRKKRRGLKHIPEEYHFTHWAAEKTIEFINRSNPGQPFFCFMSVFDPHNPYDDYPLEYAGLVNKSALTKMIPAEPESIYALQQERNLSYLGPADSFSTDDVMEMRLGYFASLALLDKEVGRVLAVLEQKGLTDDTLVIFVSDHGDSLGDHGLFVKGVHMYDHAIRVPLLMRWPGHIPAGRRIPALVQLHDLAATILSAAGVAPPDSMADSANLLPVCTGQVNQVHQHAFCLYRNTGINDKKDYFDPPLNSSMIRDERYKLVLYHAVPEAGISPSIQLFDMQIDPDEQLNLAHNPDFAEIKASLLTQLADWLQQQARGMESRGGESLPGEDWKKVINNRF